jgi:hypothetical protein
MNYQIFCMLCAFFLLACGEKRDCFDSAIFGVDTCEDAGTFPDDSGEIPDSSSPDGGEILDDAGETEDASQMNSCECEDSDSRMVCVDNESGEILGNNHRIECSERLGAYCRFIDDDGIDQRAWDASPQCLPKLEVGESCQTQNDCQSNTCIKVGEMGFVCVPEPRFGTCSEDSDCRASQRCCVYQTEGDRGFAGYFCLEVNERQDFYPYACGSEE